MKMVNHPNIVRLKQCFYSNTEKDETYLHLVLEFVPDTVYRISKSYSKNNQRMPPIFVKLYTYQMCRALGHIHKYGICHRDIKPQNLLVNTENHQLKLCDFGSAKVGVVQRLTAAAGFGSQDQVPAASPLVAATHPWHPSFLATLGVNCVPAVPWLL
eukprot:GHRQ01012734.1.p2 GENE.GHRQ01012734.1~~GHRQ01012734.1.p2  ORF type:complete len:157 (-),score=62.68 GHRQ01012734.1:1069-1539(-)